MPAAGDRDSRASRTDTCSWHSGLPDYEAYHDQEWGRPVPDDSKLFEKICLEGFQAGLSWLTILRKRDSFRRAFADFDIDRVATFTQADVARLVNDAGIVRHRGKIASVINNASRAIELRSEFGSLATYFWSYEPAPGSRPTTVDEASIAATTAESTALSKDLKRRGWTFVGPTTVYAFMQAMGLVNDHVEGCWCRLEIEAERNAYERPTVTRGSTRPTSTG
ncbi:MAG: DNA-3-methyladenine glycosylase I [Alphaproteobacteria bacterium]